MDGLNPVLWCVWELEKGLANGRCAREVLLEFVESMNLQSSGDSKKFRAEVLDVMRALEGLEEAQVVLGRATTTFRRALFAVIFESANGRPVLSRLKEIRIEIESQLALDVKSHVEALPLKMLAPLLLFQFPAFLILLFGPILHKFWEVMTR